ncbi:MAG: FdtA/QdtA family cupin domain-containing protein [Bacilli bacterium]|nr:FdtA/QdtA family cupin domain-containing protein [Bacilli bacterium]
MENNKKYQYKYHSDKYGKLIALEENEEIPFNIKRVYYIYDVESKVRRGFHSHKNLEQVLICVHGSVKILLKTPDEEQIITLDNPNKGLYIGADIWREMYDFENGAVLLVLASDLYDENDYIRDYTKYEKYYREKVMRK